MNGMLKMDVASCLARAAANVSDHNFLPAREGPPALDERGHAVHPVDATAARLTAEGLVTRETWFAGPVVRREALGLLAVAAAPARTPASAAEAEQALLRAVGLAEREPALGGPGWPPSAA